MFTCHNDLCKQQCKRIIAHKDGLFCENCFKVERPSPTYLHQKDENGMRWTQRFGIDARTKSKDDGKTIIDRRTGKPTQYFD
jgi:hypothetical protein